MPDIPSLPAAGPLRLLAISGSVSLIALLASAIVLMRRRQSREARWAAAAVALSSITFGMGRLAPAIHPVATAATLVVVARNVWRFAGTARLLESLGLVAWLVAIAAARALFGR